MDTELFVLCKEVAARTGWLVGEDESDMYFYREANEDKDFSVRYRNECPYYSQDEYYPVYTSDYLLEKLPPVIQDPDDKKFKHIQMWINGDKTVHAGYVEPYAHDDKVAYAQKSDEMCKTLLKITIALDDAGLLDHNTNLNIKQPIKEEEL